jgi:epimerase transport system membrane fusion protein
MARLNAHEGEIAVLQQRIEQLGEQVRGTKALMAGKERLKASFDAEFKDYSDLVAQGYSDKQRLRELERNLAHTEGEVAELVSDVARLEMAAGEAQLEILQLQKKFRTSVVEDLGATQIEVYDLEERIRAAADRAQRTEILSPVDGVVVGLQVTTVGGVVRPGDTLLYVVPQSEELIVEARLNPADIDRVGNGQRADIRFSSFNSATTPVRGWRSRRKVTRCWRT